MREQTDLRALAKEAMHPIQKKLQGVYTHGKERHERQMTTDFLVEVLIQEATSVTNLVRSCILLLLQFCVDLCASQAKMYLGWSAWH